MLMFALSALLISNCHCFPCLAEPIFKLTLIHLQDVNRVSKLQGELHVLRGIEVVDGWKREGGKAKASVETQVIGQNIQRLVT